MNSKRDSYLVRIANDLRDELTKQKNLLDERWEEAVEIAKTLDGPSGPPEVKTYLSLADLVKDVFYTAKREAKEINEILDRSEMKSYAYPQSTGESVGLFESHSFGHLEDRKCQCVKQDTEPAPPTPANTPDCGLTFSQALVSLRRGGKIARMGWNGKGLWLEVQVPDANSKMTLPYIYINYPVGSPGQPFGARCPWLASQTDLLTDDWRMVD